ncbi:2-amino-4-hydroxy-6-hydroxymethyldihydropteridine diphosphokinase [Lewinella sp. 4G2]|uniref:2-amino-4-hydroxy-6- hydroxymethyldihydropteridine diphosphokinase n=1 Tax=Lewinella sp. 4G2 TaxID=1803372 RepID=UPI0007B4BECA|nr:2-amino-4-hydroxy-6-hydroxymethyldihydropteridine diphosphokinase [Lewinella sp. 4G2]OAV45372.1 2-amino-4-hydroxy-6-hydroxymethyldihydropteridine diphosphokinase [Lewinella sp. 4G2]
MKIRQVTLALGTNLGDRPELLARARKAITETIGPITAATEEINTAAWGNTDQPDFLNQVITVQPTVFSAHTGSLPLADQLHQLLATTQTIELDLGRDRKEHWGPRTCDIDIIFVDRIRFESDRLSLPHPWWREREFVGGLIATELPWVRPFG